MGAPRAHVHLVFLLLLLWPLSHHLDFVGFPESISVASGLKPGEAVGTVAKGEEGRRRHHFFEMVAAQESKGGCR